MVGNCKFGIFFFLLCTILDILQLWCRCRELCKVKNYSICLKISQAHQQLEYNLKKLPLKEYIAKYPFTPCKDIQQWLDIYPYTETPFQKQCTLWQFRFSVTLRQFYLSVRLRQFHLSVTLWQFRIWVFKQNFISRVLSIPELWKEKSSWTPPV